MERLRYTPIILRRSKALSLESAQLNRAGVIPRLKYHDDVLYAFGLDMSTGVIGDFGGSRDKTDRDLIVTALRNFTSESCSIFPSISRNDLTKSRAIFGGESVDFILDLPEDQSPDYYSNRYKEITKFLPITPELGDILWLDAQQIVNMIENKEMKVQGFQPYAVHVKVHQALVNNIDYFGLNSKGK